MSMNELTTEEQKLLTEFLGECWHEDGGLTVNHADSEDNPLQLRYCKQYPQCKVAYVHPDKDTFPRLDFSDWRVVGRLIEKIINIQLVHLPGDEAGNVYLACIANGSQWFQEGAIKARGSTPQLAICRAVLAYLKEKE